MIFTLTELAGLTHAFPFAQIDYVNEASVTDHPVEIGAEVSDHVQIRPPRFTVEAFVTSSPLTIPEPFAIESARAFLEQAIGQIATLTIPGEGVFASYVLEGFAHSKTGLQARAFTLRFRHVRIALGISVAIPARMPAPVAEVGAPDEGGLGQQATTPVTDASLLKQGADAVSLLLGLGG